MVAPVTLLSESVTVIPESRTTAEPFSVKARFATVAVTSGRPFALMVIVNVWMALVSVAAVRGAAVVVDADAHGGHRGAGREACRSGCRWR